MDNTAYVRKQLRVLGKVHKVSEETKAYLAEHRHGNTHARFDNIDLKEIVSLDKSSKLEPVLRTMKYPLKERING